MGTQDETVNGNVEVQPTLRARFIFDDTAVHGSLTCNDLIISGVLLPRTHGKIQTLS